MKTKILFTGDSITDAARTVLCQDLEKMLGSDPNFTPEKRDEMLNGALGTGYPLLVTSQLYAESPGKYEVLNRGISGNRVVDLDARIKCDCINLKPDILSIMIGINDVWHEANWHNGVDAQKFQRVYDEMLKEVIAALPEVKLILLEPYVLKGPATRDKWEFFRTETDLRRNTVKALAKRYGAACINTQELFDRAAACGSESNWSADGVHPTPAGHWLLAQAWLEVFRKLE